MIDSSIDFSFVLLDDGGRHTVISFSTESLDDGAVCSNGRNQLGTDEVVSADD